MLAGIDSTELIDTDNSHPPFVFGATFAEPGTAEFATFAMVQVVPESTSLLLASLGMGCLSLWGYTRQKSTRGRR